MQIRHILAPVDFTPFSERALRTAAALAESLGAELSVLHALDERFGASRPFEATEAELAAFVGRLGETVGPPRQHVLLGQPAYASEDWAVENGVDLVVCGTHGRSGISRALLGSNAEKLARSARLPVLIARDGGDLRGGRVLFASDLATQGISAQRMAAYLTRTLGCSLLAAHVVARPRLRAVAGEQVDEAYRAALKSAQEGLAKLDFDGLEVETHAVCGTPAEDLVELARIENVSLIVCGTRGKSGLRRLLLGSVAERLIRTAPCSVLVVPHLPGA